jgi:hypothetical protein
MPPAKSLNSEERPVHDLSRNSRRHAHKKAKREREQLLLVSSELDAVAVAELAAQERQRVIADRDARRDQASALACADRVRIREGCPSSLCTPPAVDAAEDVSDLAVRTLRESQEQSALERRVLSRLAASLERAARCQSLPLAPLPALPVALLPAPAHRAIVADSGPGPSPPSSAPHATLELSAGAEPERVVAPADAEPEREPERVVAPAEAAGADPGRRSCSSASPACPPARPPAVPADLLLPDGSSVAQALAAKDARIAQLLFELEDRGARQLEDSLGRAAAFLRDPSNLLAAPPPAEPAPEPVSPRARYLSPPPRGEEHPPSPACPARSPLQLSWGLGLARGSPLQSRGIPLDRLGLAQPPACAPPPPPPPWA